MPDIGPDLVAAYATGYFEGMQGERVMAALELLRHGEITFEQTAALGGITEAELLELMKTLPIRVFQGLAQRVYS